MSRQRMSRQRMSHQRVNLRLCAFACLLLVACTSRGGSITGEGLKPKADDSTSRIGGAGPGATASEAPSPGDAASQSPFDAGKDGTYPPFSPDPEYPNNTMPLDVDIDPKCGELGSRMHMLIATRPNVILGFATEYAKKYPPDYPPGPVYTDSKGQFQWTWLIRSDTPEGDAVMRVAAGRSGVGAAARNEPFRVAASC